MDPNTAAVVSAIAAAVAALFTALIAWPNFAAARTAARSADFDSCLEVIGKLADAQRRVFEARKDDQVWEFEFRELLNLMEGLAKLEKHRRTPTSTRELTNDFLMEGLAHLKSQP